MKYSVMVTRTRTVVSTVEIEFSGKDEEAACEKAEERIQKAITAGKLDSFDWEDSDENDDEFEYDASEV